MASAESTGPSGAQVTVPLCGTTTGWECAVCGAFFLRKDSGNRHKATCAQSTLAPVECGIVRLGEGDKVAGSAGKYSLVINGDGNTTTVVETQNIIVVGDQFGDIIRAGTPEERDLIIRTILENATVRAATTNPTNVVGGIFAYTKGTKGPHKLRNVCKSKNRVTELHAEGMKTYRQLDYCRSEALRLIRILRDQADVIGRDPSAPKKLREWSQDVLALLTGGRPPNFGEMFELYCRADPKFYRLPADKREEIAEAVKGIGYMITRGAL